MNKREILKELKSIVDDYSFVYYCKTNNEFKEIIEGILADLQELIEKLEESDAN